MARHPFRYNRASSALTRSSLKLPGRRGVGLRTYPRRDLFGSGFSSIPGQGGLDLVSGTIEARYSRR